MANRIVALKEEVYTYVSKHGPILPQKIASAFKASNLFISALLSELVTNKRIKITKAKIGSSPLYYCANQANLLSGMLKSHVGERRREALELLQEKRVLRDRDCLPYERVALREIPDFAKSVKFIIQDTEELFWKWHMLPDEEAKGLIEKVVEKIYSPKKEEEAPEPKPESKPVEKQVEEKPVEVKPVLVKKKVKKKKKIKQTTLSGEEKKEVSNFEKEVLNYLEQKNVKVLEKRILRKNTEINLIVQIASDVGALSYYVKARNKKRLVEGDLLLAFTEGQNMKMPTLFITNGNITKKATSYMEKNLRGMKLIQL